MTHIKMNEDEINRLVEKKIEERLSKLIKSDRLTIENLLQILDGRNIQTGRTTGTKIGTAADQKLGFYGTIPIIQGTNGADLTNNVTSGGTNDTIDDYTDLSTYANDASAIRNNIYQLARKLKVVNDYLRDIGLMD